MSRLAFAAGLAAAALLLAAPPARAQKLVRDYDFKAAFKDAAAQGPDLKPAGGTLDNGRFNFLAGEGLHLDRAGVRDHYTIEIVFQFDDVESWQKVIDFKNLGADEGLYVYEGRLQFYDSGIGGEFRPGKQHTARLERDRGTKRVRGFLDGVPVFEFVDGTDAAVFADERAAFFLDDTNTADETSAGSVARIRIWDAPGGK
jgi:hypothetical protein